MPQRIVFLLGGPGAGKGTQSAELLALFPDFVHFSVGDLLRAERQDPSSPFAATITSLIDNGRIVPSDIAIQVLQRAIASRPDAPVVLVDGFPRAIEQYTSFQKIIGEPDFMIFLNVPDSELMRRLTERFVTLPPIFCFQSHFFSGKSGERADDQDPTIIQRRFSQYYELTYPVLEFFRKERSSLLREIDGHRPIPAVLESLLPLFAERSERM
jgi:UMP-CMP kinase